MQLRRQLRYRNIFFKLCNDSRYNPILSASGSVFPRLLRHSCISRKLVSTSFRAGFKDAATIDVNKHELSRSSRFAFSQKCSMHAAVLFSLDMALSDSFIKQHNLKRPPTAFLRIKSANLFYKNPNKQRQATSSFFFFFFT